MDTNLIRFSVLYSQGVFRARQEEQAGRRPSHYVGLLSTLLPFGMHMYVEIHLALPLPTGLAGGRDTRGGVHLRASRLLVTGLG